MYFIFSTSLSILTQSAIVYISESLLQPAFVTIVSICLSIWYKSFPNWCRLVYRCRNISNEKKILVHNYPSSAVCFTLVIAADVYTGTYTCDSTICLHTAIGMQDRQLGGHKYLCRHCQTLNAEWCIQVRQCSILQHKYALRSTQQTRVCRGGLIVWCWSLDSLLWQPVHS